MGLTRSLIAFHDALFVEVERRLWSLKEKRPLRKTGLFPEFSSQIVGSLFEDFSFSRCVFNEVVLKDGDVMNISVSASGTEVDGITKRS